MNTFTRTKAVSPPRWEPNAIFLRALVALVSALMVGLVALPAPSAEAQSSNDWWVILEDTNEKYVSASYLVEGVEYTSHKVDVFGWQSTRGGAISDFEKHMVSAVIHNWFESSDFAPSEFDWSWSDWGYGLGITYEFRVKLDPLNELGCSRAMYRTHHETVTFDIGYRLNGELHQGQVQIDVATPRGDCLRSGGGSASNDSMHHDGHGVRVSGHCGACQVPPNPSAPEPPDVDHLIA